MDHSRTETVVGKDGLGKLSNSAVAIFGAGGVGGYTIEALARAGIGKLYIIDYDLISESNLNRQIIALDSTIGEKKTDAFKKRISQINPEAKIITNHIQLTPDNVSEFIPADADYAIDAIDEIDPKVSLILELLKQKIPFISSMGAGSRLDPLSIRLADISKTEYCPLARKVRKKLRQNGINKGVKCLYSEEKIKKSVETEREKNTADNQVVKTKKIQGSISYMPGIFGLTAAGLIIKDILNQE